jgi:hypothetical protein
MAFSNAANVASEFEGAVRSAGKDDAECRWSMIASRFLASDYAERPQARQLLFFHGIRFLSSDNS